jgi:hypothetical protein
LGLAIPSSSTASLPVFVQAPNVAVSLFIQICKDIELVPSDILVKLWGHFGEVRCQDIPINAHGTYLERQGLEVAPIHDQDSSAVKAMFRLLNSPERLISFDIRWVFIFYKCLYIFFYIYIYIFFFY